MASPGESDWLVWHRQRFRGEVAPDYFIDGDGNFYCLHACANLDEHKAIKGRIGDDSNVQRSAERG